MLECHVVVREVKLARYLNPAAVVVVRGACDILAVLCVWVVFKKVKLSFQSLFEIFEANNDNSDVVSGFLIDRKF